MKVIGSFKPTVCPSGTVLDPRCPPDIGACIKGYAFEVGDLIGIPVCESTVKGQGFMGQFIDTLDPKVFFFAVFSDVLEGMLSRRGWHCSNLNESTWFHPATQAVKIEEPYPWKWPHEDLTLEEMFALFMMLSEGAGEPGE